MRFHDGAVNAAVYLKDGRIVTAGADTHIAIWTTARQQPDKILDGHTGPIASLAVSPDGTVLASASWDHTVRLWPLNGSEPRVLEGNAQNVNGVAFSPDGKNVVSAGYDVTLRIWPLKGGSGDCPQSADATKCRRSGTRRRNSGFWCRTARSTSCRRRARRSPKSTHRRHRSSHSPSRPTATSPPLRAFVGRSRSSTVRRASWRILWSGRACRCGR